MTQKLRVQRERDFSPHHLLLGASYTALQDAEKKRSGHFNYELISITLSALALEALANAFGDKFIPRWKDFESSSPIAKLRLVCEHFDIELDFSREPWGTAIWLVGFRNKVAHAKPEFIKEDKIVARDEYDQALQGSASQFGSGSLGDGLRLFRTLLPRLAS